MRYYIIINNIQYDQSSRQFSWMYRKEKWYLFTLTMSQAIFVCFVFYFVFLFFLIRIFALSPDVEDNTPAGTVVHYYIYVVLRKWSANIFFSSFLRFSMIRRLGNCYFCFFFLYKLMTRTLFRNFTASCLRAMLRESLFSSGRNKGRFVIETSS